MVTAFTMAQLVIPRRLFHPSCHRRFRLLQLPVPPRLDASIGAAAGMLHCPAREGEDDEHPSTESTGFITERTEGPPLLYTFTALRTGWGGPHVVSH